ncbi:MAG: hypothetical protein DRN27_02450 [Thermoplasmata archaeon]|nr:MAG: hypothetical protein DRN27_02450 [Thermoplasmata archaeon]
MKKIILLIYLIILIMLISTSISVAFLDSSTSIMKINRLPESMTIKKEICLNTQILTYNSLNSTNIDERNEKIISPLTIPTDSIFQITTSEGQEGHPSLAIDVNKNPFIIYDYSDSPFSPEGDIYIQRSRDGGRTWTDDDIWVWSSDDTYEFCPDISMMADGLRAYGTHEVDVLESTMYLHDYVNVNLPESWVMYHFDLSPEISYVKNTAVTTYGISTIALAGVVDFSYHEYNLEDTVVIFWNSQSGLDTWPGMYMINTDKDGNSRPISHITADSGDKIFIAYQIETEGEESEIYVAYCPSTETVFENWRINQVSHSSGNVINPSISVSGKYAYIVCQDDSNGNQDIVCYSSTSGHYWRKNIVSNSFVDELNPVITSDGEKAACLFVRDGNLYESKTENAGTSWNEPIQINDISGTVVDGYRNIDSSGKYGVWTDNRNENHDLFIGEVGPTPILELNEISLGFTIKTSVTNTGNAPEENVKWAIELDGFAVPESKKGRIIRIDAGETEEIQTDFFFGFGPISVTVTVGHLIQSVQGIGFGPFLVPN